jgi:hypothetical protein
MDGVQFVLEAVKAFEAMKPGMEGMVTAGALLSAGAKGSVYVVQKGAKLISYLIKRGGKKKAAPKEKTAARGKKTVKAAIEEPQITKEDVAIVVDISRRALVDVAAFLDKQKIDADIVMVTNDAAYGPDVKFLDANSEAEWLDVVREFVSMMNKIKRVRGGARVHIFLAAPLPLVFAMGAVWGTVDEASVYHWEQNTYHKVVNISRGLR